MSIVLAKVTAKCPVCGIQKAQIDGDRDHAIQVVTDSMTAHIAEKHSGVE